jgi:(2Fe-2S) ferredoxin
VQDVEEIVEKHLVGGEPVERLRLYQPPTKLT